MSRDAEGLPARFVSVGGESRLGTVIYGGRETTSIYGPRTRLGDDDAAVLDCYSRILEIVQCHGL